MNERARGEGVWSEREGEKSKTENDRTGGTKRQGQRGREREDAARPVRATSWTCECRLIGAWSVRVLTHESRDRWRWRRRGRGVEAPTGGSGGGGSGVRVCFRRHDWRHCSGERTPARAHAPPAQSRAAQPRATLAAELNRARDAQPVTHVARQLFARSRASIWTTLRDDRAPFVLLAVFLRRYSRTLLFGSLSKASARYCPRDYNEKRFFLFRTRVYNCYILSGTRNFEQLGQLRIL